MSDLKRYIPISLAYLFLNLFVFIFWWVVTDSGNYIWFTISEEKKAVLEQACSRLFLIKYYVWAIVLNGLLTALFLLYRKRLAALLIVMFCAVFYISCTYIFQTAAAYNYYIIFLHQRVSPDFEMEPVNDAGQAIGPYLLDAVMDTSSASRKYAAKGLGEIQYIPSISKLSVILNDEHEKTELRAEAFIALKKMKKKSSKKVLENFSRSHLNNRSDSLLLESIHIIELHDIY